MNEPQSSQPRRDVLDLDGVHPPESPLVRRTKMVGLRLTLAMLAWVDEQASIHQCSRAEWLRQVIEREYADSPRFPTDVRLWWERQAAQCGCPGDIDEALIRVTRHLAVRWPAGARLHQ